MDKKVIRIPISYEERKKNKVGEGCVPCQVTGRYFNFSMVSDVLNVGEFIYVDVMTSDTNDGKDKVLTRMIVTKEDLLEVLNKIKPKGSAD